MAVIDIGRNRQCRDTLGGVKNIYLAGWVKLSRSQYPIVDGKLLDFPSTFFHKFELQTDNSYEETQQTEDGGKYYDINLSVKFPKITAPDSLNFQRIMRKDYFVLIEDRNGNFFLSGLQNGISLNNVSLSTDQLYTLTFEGQELIQAPFATDLIGTKIITEIIEYNYIFQNGNNFIFQDGTNFIFQ